MASDKNPDYYEILGVSHDADTKAIRSAFRRLAMKYHPDRCKDADAEEKFKRIAEAYAVLSDPQKRAAYDARGRAGVADFSQEDLFGGIDFDELFGGHDFGFNFGLGGGLFDQLFRRKRKPAEPAHGANLEIRLELPLERIASGGEETVRFTRPQTCPHCGGSGAEPGHPPQTCSNCAGTGRKTITSRRGGIAFQQISTCPVCHGAGQIIGKPCRQCGGRGEVAEEEKLKVKIPAGVEEGMVLRISGHGMPNPQTGGAPGDLYVVVHSRPDTRFERRGADLWHDVTIDVLDAILGTTLQVSTLEGAVSVNVPPASQPGTILRLPGKGLPEFGDRHRGNLYLRLHLRLPKRLSAAERELYERLRALQHSSKK